MDKGTSAGMIDMTSSDLSELRGAGAITLFALASAVVLGIVFYGPNGGETQRTASAPAAASSAHPQAGMHLLTGIPARAHREFHASTKMG